jgi:hypothetical protein
MTTTFEYLKTEHDRFEARRIETGYLFPDLPFPGELPAGYIARPFVPQWVSADMETVCTWAGHDLMRNGEVDPGWWGFLYMNIAPCTIRELVGHMHHTFTLDVGELNVATAFPDVLVTFGNFTEISFSHRLYTKSPVQAFNERCTR